MQTYYIFSNKKPWRHFFVCNNGNNPSKSIIIYKYAYYARIQILPTHLDRCSTVKFIGFPTQHIGFNVFGNMVHFIGLAEFCSASWRKLGWASRFFNGRLLGVGSGTPVCFYYLTCFSAPERNKSEFSFLFEKYCFHTLLLS